MLPAPKLDDRSFQQLVDEAKRYVQQRCPEWTDHNVSDPGVTLIETFAWMTDILLYRLNRVTDRLHLSFLDLIGVRRFPPAAARAEVDFRLSAPQPEEVVVPAGAEVATRRTTTDPSVTFTLTDELRIVPSTIVMVGTSTGGEFRPITDLLGTGRPIECFTRRPEIGDALYLGFERAVPWHTVVVSFVCELGGHGINPDDPPLLWEAWTGRWEPCETLRDDTAGFNRTGRVELAIPKGHVTDTIDGRSLGWIRCRVIDHTPAYESSPMLLDVSGSTIAARGEVVNAIVHDRETLGVSTGVPGQELPLEHTPVLPDRDAFVLHVRTDDVGDETAGPTVPGRAGDEAGTQVWELRPDFADSTSQDHHFTLDATDGVIRFGPAVRLADGTMAQHGAIPAKGATITVRRYRSGGGAAANVGAGAICVLRSSVPLVASVRNQRPARGGVDGETVAEAIERGPLRLATRNRAVTIDDFEVLAREADREIARVRAVLESSGPDAGAIRVLIVPAIGGTDGEVTLADLDPDEQVGRKVAAHLDERKLVGTRVLVQPPTYLGLHLRATVVAHPRRDPSQVRREAIRALRRHFHPVIGGTDGRGWPFGRAVRETEVSGVLHRLSGIDIVDDVTLVLSHPATGQLLGERSVIELGPTNLVLVTDVELTVKAPE